MARGLNLVQTLVEATTPATLEQVGVVLVALVSVPSTRLEAEPAQHLALGVQASCTISQASPQCMQPVGAARGTVRVLWVAVGAAVWGVLGGLGLAMASQTQAPAAGAGASQLEATARTERAAAASW